MADPPREEEHPPERDGERRSVLVPIEVVVPDGLESKWVNYFVVQIMKRELFLLCCELRPLVLLPPPAQQSASIQQPRSVPAHCVARLVIPLDEVPGLIQVLKQQYERAQAGETTMEPAHGD